MLVLRERVGRNGGAEGARTPDPKTASLVLSQLSYSPTGANESTVGPIACQLDRRSRVRAIDRRRLFLYAMTPAPKWRNWQTRTTQNRVPVRVCGFDSHLRHHISRTA
jgi:hypothetical protein